jgi:hypothetical protein
VATASVGMSTPEFLAQNVETVRDFRALPESEMRELSGELSTAHKAAIDRFLRRHVDC